MGTEQQQRTGEAEQQQQTDTPDPREQRREAESTENSDEEPQMTEKPEVTDEHKEEAKKIAKAYNDDLQTTTLPGSGGTVSGTAVTDWVDDKDKGKIETTAEEGNVEYRNTEEFRKIQES